jgi:hypothetical protein
MLGFGRASLRLLPQDCKKILAEYGSLPESPWPDDDRGFICYFSDNHLSFCLNFGMDKVMKAIVDVMADFDCPVYDPQFDRRARAAKNLQATVDMMKDTRIPLEPRQRLPNLGQN